MKNPLFAVTGPSDKLARRSLFLAASGALLLLAQTLSAQTPVPAVAAATSAAPFKVGIINAELALESTKEGKKAADELQQKLGPKQQALQKLNADIQDLQKKLDQGGNTMSAATKADTQNSIQTKTRQLQRDNQDFQDEAQKQQSLVLADLYAKMEGVIKKYATDNGYSLILNVATDNSPVLWFSNEIEITQAIIEAYDKAAPVAPKTAAPAKPSTPPSKPPATGLSPAAPPKPPVAPTTAK